MFSAPAKKAAPISKEGVSKPHSTMEKPGMSHGGEDHKAAIAKMHPEHLHKMVKAAHAGEYGAKAQQMAQQAMQGQSGAPGAPMDGAPQQDGMDESGGKDYASMFGMGSGGGMQRESQPTAKPDRASMFGRSMGGE